jgi:hypothetical protein
VVPSVNVEPLGIGAEGDRARPELSGELAAIISG